MEKITKENLKILSSKWPLLHKYIRNQKIDLQNDEAKAELQKAMAYAFYNITLVIPENYLVPMVNNRISYLNFVKKIIKETDHTSILDIGTGSTCIYPLLGCRILSKSTWIGTEISQESLEIAEINVKRNFLQERITILKVSGNEFFTDQVLKVDFVMTNPPFYSAKEELEQGFLLKRNGILNVSEITQAKDQELYTSGGEFEFIKRMIQEGLDKKLQMWMSSMVGKKSNFLMVLKVLKGIEEVREIKSDSFQLGRTKRWLVAWRFNFKQD